MATPKAETAVTGRSGAGVGAASDVGFDDETRLTQHPA